MKKIYIKDINAIGEEVVRFENDTHMAYFYKEVEDDEFVVEINEKGKGLNYTSYTSNDNYPRDFEAIKNFVAHYGFELLKRWTPEIEENYWYVTSIGEGNLTFNADIDIDNKRISIGNCFRTEEDALNSNIAEFFKSLKEA